MLQTVVHMHYVWLSKRTLKPRDEYLDEKPLSSCYYYFWNNLNISAQNWWCCCCCWSMHDFFFLLGGMDYHNIRKRGGRALLALGIPIKHDLNFDTQNSLRHPKHTINIILHRINTLPACLLACFIIIQPNLSEKDVSNSWVDIISHWLTRWYHISIFELHRLCTLCPQFSTNNHLFEC